MLKTFNADLLGISLNMVDLSRRRHHKDPGSTYKAYSKYYSMETKRSIFGWNKAPKPGSMTSSVKSVPTQASPSEARIRAATSKEVSTH